MRSRDFLGYEWEYDCMGCAISEGALEVPGGLIQRTDNFCVHQDPLIPLPGFLVIASRKHIRSIAQMGEAEYQEFSDLVRTTHRAIKQVTEIDHLTIVQEENSPHFHLWFFPWTQSVLERYGPPSLSKIRGIMTKLRDRPLSQQEWIELEKVIDKLKEVLMPG